MKSIKKKGGLSIKWKPKKRKSSETNPSNPNTQKRINSKIHQSLEQKIASISKQQQSNHSILQSENKKSHNDHNHNYDNNNNDDDNDDDFMNSLILQQENLLQMSDTLLAIRSLIQKNAAAYFSSLPTTQSRSNEGYPFVLRQMLHSVLLSNHSTSDNHADAATLVMEDLAKLQKQNQIRLLKLPSLFKPYQQTSKHTASHSYIFSQEDIAIMETHTYIQAIQQATEVYNESSSSSSSSLLQTQLFTSITNKLISILQTHTRMSISHSILTQTFTPTQIDILIQKGFLLPSQDRSNHSLTNTNNINYYFILPTFGTTVNQIHHGRSYILQRLQQSYQKELSKRVVYNMTIPFYKKTKNGQKDYEVHFSMSFHLRDLHSLGKITYKERPSGTFVQLVS